MRVPVVIGIVAASLVWTPAAWPAGGTTSGATWTVTGPGKGPTATVAYDGSTVSLAVHRAGQVVLKTGPLGLVTEQVDLSKDLTPVGRNSRWVIEHYRTTVGKRDSRTALMRETTFSFEGSARARLDLVVRAAEDGIAYRFVLPANYGAVIAETSAYELPPASPAWLAPWQPRQDYENPFQQTTAGGAAAGEFMHPALFESGGSFALVAEADVDGRHSGGRLVHDAGTGSYRIKLADEKVQVSGPFVSPWRTMIVGDLATVAGSTLVDDLATPSRVRDTSWIRPGSVFWSWLAGSREAGQSLKIQRTYVDYAAAHGWPYVLVDAGWYLDPNWDYDPTWETTSWIPDLIRYAAARRVKVLLWVHYGELDTGEERARRLALFERWGAAGLKIDFMDSDGQERLRWYDQILPETAKHHLLVNFHGSAIPRGLHRTWPHVMTMEGVWGAEHSSGLTTSHLAILPFTRNVVGSMDYTPMAWHRANRPTSDAHELALSVIYESGHQNFAGRVEGYVERPVAERFLDQVPTVWDETKLLAGRPAEGAVFARRSADRWFLGGGFSGAARTVSVPLDLGPGRWLVEIIRDGLVREQRVLDHGQNLTVDIVKDGGFAGIACRWHGQVRATCDRPVRTVPSTTVTVSPTATSLTPAASFEVTGRFTTEEQLRDLTLAPRVPAGWTVRGAPVTARRLRPGQSIAGTWTVTTPTAPAAFGYLDLPVVASFRDGRRTRIEDEQNTQVHLWRPLPAGWSYLSDLPFVAESNGLGPVERDLTNAGAATRDGRGIAIRRATYGKGLGMFATGEVSFALGGRCTRFVADVGVDDEAGLNVARQRAGGTVAFSVLGDGSTLSSTGTVHVRTPAQRLDVDVSGVQTLTLRVTDGGDDTRNDHASWADARLACAA